MHTDFSFWIFFNVFVLVMLAVDLGIFNRKAHKINIKEAIIWTGVWITLAMCFNWLIYNWKGPVKALEFFTGYIIEKSLSLDNIFVFALIFSYFRIPDLHQHKILFWGIIGALIMRAAFIFAGMALLEKFHWMIYVFGMVLIYTGYKMLRQKHKNIEPDKNFMLKLFRRLVPVTNEMQDGRFFVRQTGKTVVTPLFLVLVVVESTDLLFAIDSIPAILAITDDRFIVYTSNVFAILGLRSLYFALAGIIDKFRYLPAGLSVILILAGIKMLIVDFYKVPVQAALLATILILAVSICASVFSGKKNSGPTAA